MVGREDETRVVRSLIEEVIASGRPRLVTIVAGAGVGKSRLVREVVAAARRRRPDVRVLRGRCLAAGDGITYWALASLRAFVDGARRDERGDVPGWVMITLMSALLVAGLLAIAGPALTDLFNQAISQVSTN